MPKLGSVLKHTSRSRKARASLKDVIAVATYFSHFSYPVTAYELWCFLPVASSLKEVSRLIRRAVEEEKLVRLKNTDQYALGGHGISDELRIDRARNTENIITSNEYFFKLIKWVPWIELVGISGSCAMDNATQDDDLDIFIISAPGRIWLSRVSAICIAKITGKHRKYQDVQKGNYAGKICLNLFFDKNAVEIPQDRRNLYTAHEVVQMRPMMMRGEVYALFIQANSWVQEYFPNVVLSSQIDKAGWRYQRNEVCMLPESRTRSWLGDVGESVARWFQLKVMHAQTQELVSDKQLWFFPQDFSIQLRKKIPL